MLRAITKKYDIIYADPPWKYSNTGVNGAACKHYKTMSVKDICALPVGGIAKENCALFLWGTWPQLDASLLVMKEWGFRYVSCAFLWVKLVDKFIDKLKDAVQPTLPNLPQDALREACAQQLSEITSFGAGFYTRANTEVCLLGIRGKFTPVARNVRQVVFEWRSSHSTKPDAVRRRIELLAGDSAPDKIELFARRRAPGWDAVGDELEVAT